MGAVYLCRCDARSRMQPTDTYIMSHITTSGRNENLMRGCGSPAVEGVLVLRNAAPSAKL